MGMGRYISVTEYAITLVVLSLLVLVFGIMWFMENLGYSALEQHYTILQNKYQSLLVQYEIATSNSTLLQLYKQSQEKYNDLVSGLSSVESYGDWYYGVPIASVDIKPGGSVMYPIVVPGGCNATVEIGVGVQAFNPNVYVYVATLSSMNEASSTLEAPTMLYKWQVGSSGIDEHITLGSGVYIVTILNPVTSQSSTTVFVGITTTLHCG